MLIEIFADFSCPWCFIGRRRLARALSLRPQISAEIVWQPFQLNPDIPPGGFERQAYLRGKFIDRERIRAMEAGLQESGAKEGIRFAFSQIRTVPNTLLAHGLMRFAARSRREGALAEQLFQSYFERGEDIGRRDVLEACAADAGIDRDAARCSSPPTPSATGSARSTNSPIRPASAACRISSSTGAMPWPARRRRWPFCPCSTPSRRPRRK